jgi:hypothetical protein
VHSVYSDGKLTPGQLAAGARAVGLDFIATTEHNTAEWGRGLAAGIQGGRWRPALGNSDTHLEDQIGTPQTVVLAEELSTGARRGPSPRRADGGAQQLDPADLRCGANTVLSAIRAGGHRAES